MDADLSHDPRHLPDADRGDRRTPTSCIGSRYVPGGAIVNWPLRRRLLSRFANIYIRPVTRLDARDCTSGYRCWRREALAALPLDRFVSDGYSFLVEMLFVAAARAAAASPKCRSRSSSAAQGESKLSRAVLLESAITPWRLIAGAKPARRTARLSPVRAMV